MRAVSCLIAFGFVVAAIFSGAADEKVKKSSPKADAKALNANAPGPADKGKVDKSRSAKDDEPEGKSAQTVASDEAPDKNAAEEIAILKTGISFVSTYAEHDAKAVAAHFAPDAEYVDEDGQVFQGRAEIEATLDKVFKEHPKALVALDVEALRFLSPVLAIEDGMSISTLAEDQVPASTRYTAIHTKSDGQWLVASVREHGLQGKRLHAMHLRQLDWLVGNWVDEDEDSIVRFNCQMAGGGNYLVRDFDVCIVGQKVLSGSQRTGWDPNSGKLRAWTFDSDGGYFDGMWHLNGEKWVLTSTGVTADGESATGTTIFTPVDENTITWQAVDREIDGVPIEDSDEFTLVRTGPEPQKSEEPDSQ